MEVLNLAASALFKSLERHNIDQSLLIKGTNLKMDEILKLNKKHSWDQFVKMYENCSMLLGADKCAKEIGYQGIYNEHITPIRKIGTGLIDAKTVYWYTAAFVSRHLFKGCVSFKYTKIKSNHVSMEITIRPGLKDCPLLFEAYTYLFENIPVALGLSKAKVMTRISERKGEYDIYLKHTSFFKYLFSRFVKFNVGYKDSIELMGQLENQSIELSKLVEEKSQLLRILSHDISNQVSVIDYYLKKVLQGQELNEEDQKYLEIAKKSSRRLCDILKNVQNLEITHIRGVNLEPVDLELVFLSLADNFAPQLNSKNLTLKCKNTLPPNVMALAEKSSLEINVLGNLISNAIKFSPAGSVIQLEASLQDGKILISVIDQGVGISSEERSLMFSKKIRNSTLGTNGEVGTGFGLGIVSNYVDLYGGKISVHQNVPKGTIFTIELTAQMPHFFDGLSQFNIKTFESTHGN